MASITVDNLDDELVRQLCIEAKKNGRSPGEEVKSILHGCIVYEMKVKQSAEDVFQKAREAIGGGIDIEVPPSPSILGAKMARTIQKLADEQGRADTEVVEELLAQALDEGTQ